MSCFTCGQNVTQQLHCSYRSRYSGGTIFQKKKPLQMGMRVYVARVWPLNKSLIQAFIGDNTHYRISDSRRSLLMWLFCGFFLGRLSKHCHYLTFHFLPVISQVKMYTKRDTISNNWQYLLSEFYHRALEKHPRGVKCLRLNCSNSVFLRNDEYIMERNRGNDFWLVPVNSCNCETFWASVTYCLTS